MSTAYLAKAKSVYAKLKAKGTSITIVRQKAAAYDAPSDTETGGGTTTFTAPGIVLAPTTQTEQTYAQQFQSEALIKSNVRKVLLAALDDTLEPFELQEDDVLRFGGFDWSILGWKSLNPDFDVSIMHDIAVHK